MKRLAAAAISSTFLLCAPPVAHAQPREEVIRERQCNVQKRVYVQTQGTPRVLGGTVQHHSAPSPADLLGSQNHLHGRSLVDRHPL